MSADSPDSTGLAEIDRLIESACQEAWIRGISQNHGGFPDSARAALLAALRPMVKDVERYRWLKQGNWNANVNDALRWAIYRLDEAIDAAIAAAGQK